MLENFLDKLQKKPYETRLRILWMATGVIAIALIAVWIFSLKLTIKNTSTVAPQAVTKPESASVTQFLKVERTEQSDSTLKIYFNLDNQTSDILNVSSADDITLQISALSLHPSSILDRQNQPFVQKVLSHTQAFGILIFNATPDTSGELTFDNLILEKDPNQPLKQTLDLDFTKLNKATNVRN